jgi:hypothetical protein
VPSHSVPSQAPCAPRARTRPPARRSQCRRQRSPARRRPAAATICGTRLKVPIGPVWPPASWPCATRMSTPASMALAAWRGWPTSAMVCWPAAWARASTAAGVPTPAANTGRPLATTASTCSLNSACERTYCEKKLPRVAGGTPWRSARLLHPAAVALGHGGGHVGGAAVRGQGGGQQQVHAHRVVGAQRTQRPQLAGQFVRAVARGGIDAQAAGARDGCGHLDAVGQAEDRYPDAQAPAQGVAQAHAASPSPHHRSGSRSRQGCCGRPAACCSTWRPIRPLWISLVPSPIWFILASRKKRSSG